jgi:hypothetical protein
LPERLSVVEFLRDTGPGTGIPTLRAAFPQMPRCELVDLRRHYWEVYREHNRVAIAQLAWHAPGRVWAMDHAKPPRPVDGVWPDLLSVRDLASGMVLAWLPVADQTAATTRDALVGLFLEYGAPLVLKSDNGSAFQAEVAALLRDWQVIALPSPPQTPRYNGSCEAGIGGLKVRTQYQAALGGHPGLWTSEDTEAARRRGNEFHYPAGHDRPTPLELWQGRTPIDSVERENIHLTIERIRSQIHASLESTSAEPSTAARRAAIHRRVVRQALLELGILSTTWRLITLPLKPKKWAKIL